MHAWVFSNEAPRCLQLTLNCFWKIDHMCTYYMHAYIFIYQGNANVKILPNVLNLTVGHIGVHFMILSIFLPVLNFQNPVLGRTTAPVLSLPQSLSWVSCNNSSKFPQHLCTLCLSRSTLYFSDLSTHIMGHKVANPMLNYAENICSKMALYLVYSFFPPRKTPAHSFPFFPEDPVLLKAGKNIKVNFSPIS